MEGPELIAAILEGRDVRREIWERNARLSLALAKKISENRHPAEKCKKKNCVHGDEFIVQSHIDHAATLYMESQAF